MTSPLGRYAEDTHDTLVTVHLLQAPLIVWQRAAEHHDELMREMSLLALSPPHHELPTRLLELVDVLGNKYGAAGGRPDVQRDEAVTRGLDRVDLTYQMPRSSGESAMRMRALLDEAEAYCRDYLLTLAQPPVEAAFSQWYIDQIVHQCAGGPPMPWPGPWA